MRLPFAILVLAVLTACSAQAAGPDGFGIWKPSDFAAHEKVLNGKIGPDHSARETLGDYGNHRIRMIHRNATGAPEFHANFVDLWIVESGKGAIVVGGKLIDPKPMGGGDAAAGEMTGSGITGGDRHPISAGDVIHVPPGIPHQAVVADGSELTYLRIAIPAK